MEQLVAIFGLAAVDSLNPSALAVTLYLLTKKDFSPKVLAYISGIFCTYFTIGILLTLGLGKIFTTLGTALESDAAYAGQLIVGLLMFGYAVFGGRFTSKKTKSEKIPSSQKLGALFMLGVVITFVEFATALPYIAAIGILAKSQMIFSLKIAILFAYNSIMILPPLMLLVLAQRKSEKMQATFDRWRLKMQKGAREAVYWIFGIVGFLLVSDAVRHFNW